MRPLLALFLLLGLTVSAQEASTPDAPPEGQLTLSDAVSLSQQISVDLIDLDALEKALQDKVGPRLLRLSLDECIKTALEQNDDILIAAYEPAKSGADVLAARGEFDPQLQGQFTYQQSSASASQEIVAYGGVSAIESYRSNVTAALGGKLHYGTQYSLDFNASKEETTFGNFVEEFGGTLSLTLTQPLLRGFGKKANLVRIRAAQANQALSEAQLELTAMNTVSEAVKAYWDLVGATESLAVSRQALENARRLLDINQKRLEIGTAAQIDVLQAKAGVATRQSDMVSSLAQVEDASDMLKNLLGMRDGGRFSQAQIAPIDRPASGSFQPLDPESSAATLQASIDLALEKRPEVHMSEFQIESAELEELRTRRDMLPQFDLTGSYSQGGRDHKLRQTLYGIRDKQDESYSYGFQGAIPIGNRAARGAYHRAQLTRHEMEQRKAQTLQGLALNVHLAHRHVETNRILLESARQARHLQEANVTAEEKRLQLGVTTSFQVLQVQEELTAARTQEVQAEIALEKARVELLLAEGRLLEDLGVEVITPELEQAPGFWRSIQPRWE